MQKLVTCLVLVILTFLLSCQKGSEEQGGVNPTDKLIVAAQQYFDQRLTKPVDPAVKQLGPMAWYQRKQPQWGQAVTFEVDGKPVVEVPLLIDGQAPLYTLENPAFGIKGTVKAKNGVTKALFFKHEDGTLQAYVLKLIADEDYYAANSTTYQTLSLSNLKNGFSGFVMMTDWNDQLLDSYRIEKGNVVAATKVPVFNSPNARSNCQPICQNVCVGMSMPCCTMKSDPTDYCCTNTYMSCYPQCFYLCVPDQSIVEPHPLGGVAIYSSGSAYGKADPTSFSFSSLNGAVKAAAIRVGLSSTTKGPVSVFFNLQVQIPNSQGGSIINMQNVSAAAAEYATKQVLRNDEVLYTPSAQVTAGSQFRSFMQIYLQTNEGCTGCQVVNYPDNASIGYLKWK